MKDIDFESTDESSQSNNEGSSRRSDTGTNVEEQPSPTATEYKNRLHSWLHSSRSVRVFQQRISAELYKYNFTHWGYMQLELPPEVSIDEQIGSDFSGPSRLYKEDAFYECDLMLQHATSNDLPEGPIYQSVIEDSLQCLPFSTDEITRNLDIFKMTKSFGYSNSFYLPRESKVDGGRVMLTISSKAPCRETLITETKKHLDKLVVTLELIDAVGHEKFPEHFICRKKAFNDLKSHKGIRLLEVMAKHDVTQNQAAALLHMSTSTAEKRLKAVRKLLGASTTYGAISKAIASRYIDAKPNPAS